MGVRLPDKAVALRANSRFLPFTPFRVGMTRLLLVSRLFRVAILF